MRFVFLFAIVICCSHALADDVALRAACDRLVASAVHRPYGWAWVSSPDPKPTISLEPEDLPAKTLVLLRAGEVLHDLKYTEAASAVCRTMSLVQLSSGYFAPSATLNSQRPSGKAPTAGIPARGSTCAAASVLMLAGRGSDSLATRFAASGRLGETWVATQQLGAGGFASPTTQESPGHHLPRQIELDNTDIRDSYLTIALSSEIDHTRLAQSAAEKCVKRLLAMRLMNQDSAPSTRATDDPEIAKARASLYLWSKSYETSGEVTPDATSADLAASSFALQILAVHQQLHPDPELAQALFDSARALTLLRQPDGNWPRFANALPTTRPTSEPVDPFFGPKPALPATGQYGLPDVIALTTDHPTTLPMDAFEFQLAATVCHLVWSPFQSKVSADATDLQALWWSLGEHEISPNE